jgi:hypothetical protein
LTPPIRRDGRLISASEIGTWCYCKKAWHLSHSGYPSSHAEERAAGIRYHQVHNGRLRAAHQQQKIASILMLVCVLILVMIGISSLWTQ